MSVLNFRIIIFNVVQFVDLYDILINKLDVFISFRKINYIN